MRKTIIAGALLSALCAGVRADDSLETRIKNLEDSVNALQQENAELKQEVDTTGSNAASSAKFKISQPVQAVTFYGDFRLRYFTNMARGADAYDGELGERERMRYRFRLGMDVQVEDGWDFVTMFETGNLARSANVTMGENPTFAKSTAPNANNAISTNIDYGDAVFLGQVFIKYSNDWFTFMGGKMPNPFVTTRMVWDSDISPEGLAEQFRYTIGDTAPGTENGFSKDGKAVVSTPPPGGMTWDLFANFGQMIYSDTGWTNDFNKAVNLPTGTGESLYQLGWQAGARANFNKNTFLQVAPALYNYTGGGTGGANGVQGPFSGVYGENQTGVNDLLVFENPVEFDWKMWGLPFSIFGDYAHNFDGDSRADRAGFSGKGHECNAYQIGAGVGQAKKRGDLELKGWWQHSEEYALDPNIVDDDIFDGRVNMQGFYVQLTYMINDSVYTDIQACHGHIIDSSLPTPGFGALGTPSGFPESSMDLVYLDLGIKF